MPPAAWAIAKLAASNRCRADCHVRFLSLLRRNSLGLNQPQLLLGRRRIQLDDNIAALDELSLADEHAANFAAHQWARYQNDASGRFQSAQAKDGSLIRRLIRRRLWIGRFGSAATGRVDAALIHPRRHCAEDNHQQQESQQSPQDATR